MSTKTTRPSRLVRPSTSTVVATEPVVAPVTPTTSAVVTPALPEFSLAVVTRVSVSSPDDTRSFASLPVSPTLARIVLGVRAVAALPAGDTPELFASRVSAFRSGYDAGSPATTWDAVPPSDSPFGAGIMDSQNAIYAACVVAGVRLSNAGIMACWRGLIPRSKCAFETRRYGVSALADFASGRRPTSVPTVPDGAFAGVMAAWYSTDGMTKPWAVTVLAD